MVARDSGAEGGKGPAPHGTRLLEARGGVRPGRLEEGSEVADGHAVDVGAHGAGREGSRARVGRARACCGARERQIASHPAARRGAKSRRSRRLTPPGRVSITDESNRVNDGGEWRGQILGSAAHNDPRARSFRVLRDVVMSDLGVRSGMDPARWHGAFDCAGVCERKRLPAVEFSANMQAKKRRDPAAIVRCKKCTAEAAANERALAAETAKLRVASDPSGANAGARPGDADPTARTRARRAASPSPRPPSRERSSTTRAPGSSDARRVAPPPRTRRPPPPRRATKSSPPRARRASARRRRTRRTSSRYSRERQRSRRSSSPD